MSREIKFAIGEYYHIFNRGTDKRTIFNGPNDSGRFFRSMIEFNTERPIGSIYENSFRKETTDIVKPNKPLVSFLAYCLNPNHYHFILRPLSDRGIEKFMHRLGTGYTNYFNEKYKRNGVLFQGKFKATHIDTNEYLLHVSAYVNLNFKIHQLGSPASKLVVKSSWGEYINEPGRENICDKDIIIGQFKKSHHYKKFALDALEGIVERKMKEKELKTLLID